MKVKTKINTIDFLKGFACGALAFSAPMVMMEGTTNSIMNPKPEAALAKTAYIPFTVTFGILGLRANENNQNFKAGFVSGISVASLGGAYTLSGKASVGITGLLTFVGAAAGTMVIAKGGYNIYKHIKSQSIQKNRE